MKKIIYGITLAVSSANALAVPVTIDSDDYAVGTNISELISEVKIQAISRDRNGPLVYQDIIISEAPKENPMDRFEPVQGFGDNMFGGSYYNVHHSDLFSAPGSQSAPIGWRGLGLQFFEPVQYLSLNTLSFADAAYIKTYDANGNLLDSMWGALNWDTGCYCSVSSIDIQHSQADIAYVVVGGSGSGTRINEITYDVPAPSSFALLLMGAVGGVFARARKSIRSKYTI